MESRGCATAAIELVQTRPSLNLEFQTWIGIENVDT